MEKNLRKWASMLVMRMMDGLYLVIISMVIEVDMGAWSILMEKSMKAIFKIIKGMALVGLLDKILFTKDNLKIQCSMVKVNILEKNILMKVILLIMLHMVRVNSGCLMDNLFMKVI
jgi:hypothetical protein